ncbi:hypothetical protein [Xylophilus ampelinus]|uniref:Uncharacterized protein n=1 Tax=Xylophilus ampelinus TaxID=54067 RepID=A0A318SKR4_9BURK|nr:hypothetical protein [Xylophilus ampelinus]MCS4508909.1 hypothetical protein [Xylophilus ampelinus]PYE79476.1 hypothetical protein DFQ15_102209 [Xylophilus ampelinus]
MSDTDLSMQADVPPPGLSPIRIATTVALAGPLLRAMGINPQYVMSFTLRVAGGEFSSVQVESSVPESAVPEMAAILREFELVLRSERPLAEPSTEFSAEFSSKTWSRPAGPIPDVQPAREVPTSISIADPVTHGLATSAARWFALAGSHIAFPVEHSAVAARSDTAKGGLLAAAAEARELLGQSAQGRQALRDLGFEPVFHQVEGE